MAGRLISLLRAGRGPALGLAIALCWGATPALAQQAETDPAESFLQTNRTVAGVVETASGLQYRVMEPGHGGESPTDTDITLVNYRGALIDGTVFDASQHPTPMPVAAVVPGFSEALKLMTRGAAYRFWIKPALAYGDEASGPIPAHSILVFDIELLDFMPMATFEARMRQGAAAAPEAPGTP